MKEKHELTIKQKVWLKCYSNFGEKTFGNATQSAIVAYGLDPKLQHKSAKQIGWENMTKLDFEIEEVLNGMGITNVKLISKLIEGLEATKPYGKGIVYADNNARLKALGLALKLKGLLKDDVVTPNGFFLKKKLTIEVIDKVVDYSE